MNSTVFQKFFSELKVGKPQRWENLTTVPVFTENEVSFDFMLLQDGLKNGDVIVEEVDSFGSVPDIKVINNASIPVLIVEGEELVGAKQNRLVNTTILLKEKTITIIPVSCTEQGRWHYERRNFYDSKFIAFSYLRKEVRKSVNEQLKTRKQFRANQHKVWNDISEKQRRMNVDAKTGAMYDIYEQRVKYYEKILNNFKCQEEQTGLIVFINGKVAGFDFLGKSKLYAKLHTKFLKSYLADAIERKEKVMDKELNVEKIIEEFFSKIKNSKEEKYPSIGYGTDHRFKSKEIIGAGLVHNDNIVFASFSPLE